MADKSTSIPDDVWAASFKCAVKKGEKMPLGVPSLALSMNSSQFADPETFAIKVAALIRHFGCLTVDVCEDFGACLDAAAKRSATILATDISLMPGLAQPTAEWPNVVHLEPEELGASVSSRYIKAANDYSMMMWRRSFQSLRLNDKALALYYCAAPQETITPGPVAQEDSKQSQNLRLAVGRLNELANEGHVPESELQAGIESLNAILADMKRRRLN